MPVVKNKRLPSHKSLVSRELYKLKICKTFCNTSSLMSQLFILRVLHKWIVTELILIYCKEVVNQFILYWFSLCHWIPECFVDTTKHKSFLRVSQHDPIISILLWRLCIFGCPTNDAFTLNMKRQRTKLKIIIYFLLCE